MMLVNGKSSGEILKGVWAMRVQTARADADGQRPRDGNIGRSRIAFLARGRSTLAIVDRDSSPLITATVTATDLGDNDDD